MAYTKEQESILKEANKIQEEIQRLDEEILDSRLPTFLSMLKVGDQLFASCSQEVFGTIAAIRKNTVDILVNNLADLIALDSGYVINLILPSNPKVLIKEIEIEWIRDFADGDLYASFNTVRGCGGCVRRFTIHRNGDPVSGRVAVLA